MGANPRNSIKKELLHERKSFIQQLSGSGADRPDGQCSRQLSVPFHRQRLIANLQRPLSHLHLAQHDFAVLVHVP